MHIEEIRISGTVQGVGFRPTVYRIAKELNLKGDVCNDGEGVLIRVCGSQESIEEFIKRIQQESPPLANIDRLKIIPFQQDLVFNDFVISDSNNTAIKTQIAPDAATCEDCKQEIFDPLSRYYRYPFTNCTHCGPRLSIINAIPYDRYNTSMGMFAMCPECREEYADIENRRFHAQPVACYTCGPHAWLERADGKPVTAAMFSMLDDVDAVCTLLQKGEIVAIKGLGGIHLACDATNNVAVEKLRQRKQRYYKPFALMARDIQVIEKYCKPTTTEKELLESAIAPIVLIKISENSPNLPLSPLIAPAQNTLGFMLPYTPLHHLILRRMNRPIVLTSGNISDEPQCINNQEARDKLSKIADYFLFHNRDIVNRVDDSVVRVVEDKVQIIRRARGYAPAPINLPLGFENTPQILAMGSELKNTFCLLRDGKAILSQHLGDLENAAVFQSYQDTLNLYLNLFEHQPEAVAVDKHPEYLSTKLGKELAVANQVDLYQIQHHHAHIAACMVENKLPLDSPPVLGIALDGLGYSEDNTLWGGELLLADYDNFTRLATLKPFPLIGGEKAIYQPWRNTYAQLISAFDWSEIKQCYGNLEIFKYLEQKPLTTINNLKKSLLNTPLTSSTGRLFDAVAAAIGICREECSYEGQAAIEMEALIDEKLLNQRKETLTYPFKLNFLDNIYYIDPYPMWKALLSDIQQKTSTKIIAAKFHLGLAIAIVATVNTLSKKYSINHVALTGGVFQNRILLKQVTKRLQALGINVLTHSLVSCNDGGLSLGQAVIAAAKNLKRERG
ncbi:(NiFe) hydrogenase maturation protein HypF [Rivularia sp. PCC 7116]|uniref:carbamoyltransferase HypF n=1 Tax=Rivularia sp. PCC 7116 TaxID=373994 RepID=UPI00029F4668|nr:carbamoyltransferase HypF [Rivularia sp. PCC 7116]AFY58499.1 (NiFe) hydrogenase maturation protein HypF [Rivularia sp. PCC 7116]